MAIALAHRYSRFGGTLALLRMAFYAVLIPWHAVSQANAALSGERITLTAEPPCHDGASSPSGTRSETTKGSQPAGKTHCPICTGFAALHLALAATAIALPAPSGPGAARVFAPQQHLVALPVPAPQSRAPPPLAA